MKKHLLIPASILILLANTHISGFSQEITGSVKIKNGDIIERVIPSNILYLLPEFQDAVLFNHDGSRLTGRINVSVMDYSLRLIDNNGDTLNAIGTESIKAIMTDKSVIHHIDKYYLPQIAEYAGIILSEIRILTLETAPAEAKDGENTRKRRMIMPVYSRFGSGSTVIEFGNRYRTNVFEMVYHLTRQYVLAKDGYVIPISNVSAFTRIFPGDKNSIREFAETDRTDFTDTESLIRLFNFCIRNM